MVYDSTANDPTTFRQRCCDLNLFAWRYDRKLGRAVTPEETGLIGDWLRPTQFRDAVEKCARLYIEDDNSDVTTIFPDCWVFPIAEEHHTSQAGLFIVMALGPDAVNNEGFQETCAWSNIDVEKAREVMEPFCRHRSDHLAELQQLLSWCYNDCIQGERNDVAIEQFSENLVQAYEETHVLFRLARLMNCDEPPLRLMETLCNQLLAVLPFGWIGVQFGSSDAVFQSLRNRLVLAGELPCERRNFVLHATHLIDGHNGDNWTRLLQPEEHALSRLVNAEIAAEPIVHDGQRVGVLLAGNKSGEDNEMSSAETQFLDAASDFLGVFHENVARFAEQHAMFMGTIHAMTNAIDAKDPYTCGHSERVSYLGTELAVAMGLDEDMVEQVRIAGMLHDVGKIGVPEAVLCKTGRLTTEEFDLIKQHPQIGYNILKDIPPLKNILPGVLYHHERYDGHGYPEGVEGNKIPLMGRLLCIADTFDAMSSNRSYRAAMPREKVLQEIRDCSGTQFDSKLAERFLEMDFTLYDEMIERHQARASFAA